MFDFFTPYHPLLIIFAIIALGVFCKLKRVFDEAQTTGFELYLFKIALPAYLFMSTMQADFFAQIDYDYFYSYLLSFTCVAAITFLCLFGRVNFPNLCIKMLAASYVNVAIYALPIITLVLGNPKSAVLGNLIQVVLIQPIFITILSFIKHKGSSLAHKLKHVVLNPIVLLPAVGMNLNYFSVEVPTMVLNIASTLSSGASSFALFTFGLSIGSITWGRELFEHRVLLLTVIKNVIHPMVSFAIGKYIFGLQSYWLYSLVIASSSPSAFLSYILARQFDVGADLIKRVVALSSLFSLLSLIAIVYII